MASCVVRSWCAGLVALGVTNSAHAQGNGDFSLDLSSWQVEQFGGDTDPGTVTWDAGTALLVENGSHVVAISQTFSLPPRPTVIQLTVDPTPGFDTSTDNRIPDAFEVSLVDGAGQPLAEPWRTGATSAFNLQENGDVNLGPETSWDGAVLTLDVSDLAEGDAVTLEARLVGGDADTGSAVRIDGVASQTFNQAPLATAGQDLEIECNTTGAQLDASLSFDPDGDPISFAWFDSTPTQIDTGRWLDVDPPVGVHDYTVQVTDLYGAIGADAATVTVVDTTPPTVDAGVILHELDEAGTCDALVGDLTGLVAPVDGCGAVVVTQDVDPATIVGLNDPVLLVTLTSTDDAGNEAFTIVNVDVIDPDASCAVAGTGTGTGTGSTTATGAATATGTGTGTGTGSVGTATGTSTGSGSGTGSATGSGTGSATGSGTGSATGTGTGTGSTGTATGDFGLDSALYSGQSADDKGGTCGCSTTGGAGGWVFALALLVALRRRGVAPIAAAFLVVLALAPGEARAEDSVIAIGDPAGGAISVSGEVDTYAFAAAEGDRITVQAISSDNTGNLTWRVADQYGRVLQSAATFADLGTMTLMGGAYTITVEGLSGALGNYSFQVHDAPIRDLGAASLDSDLVGDIAAPGEVHRYAFDALEGQRVFVDVVSVPSSFSLYWRLIDPAGREIRPGSYFAERGAFTLHAGTYTLEIAGYGNNTSPYTIRIADVVDQTLPTSPGSSLTGLLSNASFLDTHAFTAAGGERVYLDVVSAPSPGAASLRLVDPSGNTVASAPTLADLGPIDLIAGDWRVEVEAAGPSLVPDYQIDLVAVVDSSAPASFGVPVAATVSEPGGTASYEFTATAGQRVYFHPVDGVTPWIDWSLTRSSGEEIQPQTATLAWQGPYVLDADTYTLTIDPQGDRTGTWNVQLIEPTDVSGASALGGTVNGGISEPGAAHRTSFTVPAGQLLTVDVTASSNTFGMGYTILDGVGRTVLPLRTDMGNTVGHPLAGGSYELVVLGEAGATGTFTYDLIDAGLSTFVPSGTPLALGVDTFGNAAAGVDELYTFTLASDALVFFDLLQNTSGLTWELLDSAGRSVFFGNANNQEVDSVGALDLAADTYTLRLAASSGAPAYGIRVDVVAPGSSTPLTLGTPVADAFTAPGETHSYWFDLATDSDVYLDLLSGQNRLYWSLYDPFGEPIVLDAFAFDGNAHDIQRLTLSAGTYTVVFDPLYDAVPAYEFAVHQVVDTASSHVIGDPVSVSLTSPGQVHRATFDAVDGDRIYLDITAPSFQARWSLLDPLGVARFSDLGMADAYQNQGPIELSGGTWTVLIDASGDDLAAVDFEILDAIETSDVITLSTPVLAAFTAPGETLRWVLDLSEPASVYGDMLTPYGAGSWSLVDSYGESVFSNTMNNDIGRFELAPGSYTLEASTRDGSVPTLDLQLTELVDTSETIAFEQIVDQGLEQPEQWRRYTFAVDEDGQEVMADVRASGLQDSWKLVDPVGEPVYELVDLAQDFDAVPLAAGMYTIEVTGTQLMPSWEFALLAESGDEPLDFTRYLGTPNVKRAYFRYEQGQIIKTFEEPLGTVPKADGMVVAPDGDLVIGGDENVYKLDPETGAYQTVASNGEAEHMSLDPSGTKVWAAPNGGGLLEIPLIPFGDGIPRPLTGDDTTVTQIGFDRAGRAWYTSSNWTGYGYFGRIDLQTFTTTRVLGPLEGAHGLSFDTYTGHLMLTGGNTMIQFDPDAQVVVATAISPYAYMAPFANLDQGAANGRGQLYSATGSGNMVFVDYSESGLLDDPGTLITGTWMDSGVDDVAPLSWLGAPCSSDSELVDLQPAEGSFFTPGQSVLITGRAPAVDPTRPLAAVLVDGVPAASLDVAGNFAAVHTVTEGAQDIVIEWFDRCGAGEQVLRLNGDFFADDRPSIATDAVGSLVEAQFRNTTWNKQTREVLVDVQAENVGDVPVLGPLFMAVGTDLDPAVTLANATGVSLEGRMYVEVLGDGESLDPAQLTDPVELILDDPDRRPVKFTPLWLSTGNRAPRFTSVPVTRVLANRAYGYDADAVDDDPGQSLEYSLISGPAGMSLTLSTGQLDWTPTNSDIGAHEVQIRVSDGFGGSATQVFVLSVDPEATNVPPIFTSSPPTSLAEGLPLDYDADALDADGDPIAFSLISGPSGMAIDPSTGVVTWPGDVAGDYPVELSVDDGRGGTANQAFTIAVSPTPTGGSGPVISSTPGLLASADNLYFYQPVATDPDGDGLAWSMPVSPATMFMEAVSGRIYWTPAPADVGPHPVRIEVTDGSATAVQEWVIDVTLAPANRPPVFVTTAPPTAVVGQPYIYDSEAVDPDGNAVSYSLSASPAGAVIDPPTGQITWTPSSAGVVQLGITATDTWGAEGVQNAFVTVRVGNSAPVITSGAPGPVFAGSGFEHRVTAEDVDGDVLSFALLSGPGGLSVDPVSGVVTTLTSIADLGSQPVEIQVSDGFGGVVVDAWDLTVLTEGTAPVVDIAVEGSTCIGDAHIVCVDAQDAVSIASVGLEVDGAVVELDELYCAVVHPQGPDLVAAATVMDGAGNIGEGGLTLPLVDCTGPDVAIHVPGDGERLGEPVGVTAAATATAPIDQWTLTVRPGGAPVDDGAVMASGSGDVPATVLAQLDPTQVENGLWTLRLQAVDTGGRVGFADSSVVVDGAMKLGAYDLAFLDAEWSNPITSISLVRAYSTLRKDIVGDFGHGWTLGMLDVTVQTNGPLGDDGWTQFQCGGGIFGFSTLCFDTVQPHVVVVKWPGGLVDSFDFTPIGGNTFFSPAGTAAYTARDGTFSTLRPVAGDESVLFAGDGNLYRDLSFGALYDPDTFELDDPFGNTLVLSKTEGLLEIRDHLGNRTVFTDTGIYPDIGTGVTWLRDADQRITTMSLPDGSELQYVYDGAGDLVEMVDGEGQSMEFAYDSDHRLTSYNLAGGRPIAEMVYDADGRLVSSTDGSGVFTEQSTDLEGYQTVEVGPDPGLTTTRVFDADGMLVEMIEAFTDNSGIDQAFVTSMTYDSNYRMASRTLPTGASESWSYDEQGRVLTHTDAAGVLREWTYGPNGQVAEQREGGEVVQTTTFDANDLPFEVRRGDGSLMRRVTYDAVGLPLTMESGTGQVLSPTYDANYQIDMLVLPDFGGSPVLVDVTMDGLGRLLDVTRNYPSGPGTTVYTYDANGNRLSITDARGQVMAFTYDMLGRLATYTDKLGQTVSYTYDANGRELTKTNRNGEVLAKTYDSAGRLATMTGPGVDRELEYDAYGRPTMRREGAHVEERTYDGMYVDTIHVYGTDSNGHADATWDVSYDAAGRIVDLVGPAVGADPGLSVVHSYDWRGRLWQIDEVGLGMYAYGYDSANRVATLTRPSGLVTSTAYNGAGQTTGITTLDGVGSVVHEILTTYDSRGLPDTQTDHEGLHDYEHDVAGRLIGVDHPVGAAFGDEAYSYDAADRRTSSHRDPLTEVVYDDGDRLLQDAEYTYAYDAEGRRTTRTHRVTAEVTTYSYNALDQMTSLTEDGVTWTFVYDARDLRVLVMNDAGYGETFVYDDNGLVRGTYDLGGLRTASYLTGFRFGEVLSRVDEVGAVDFALRDRQHSTRAWANALGVLDHVDRDAFGTLPARPTTVVPYGFTGHAADPTELVWGRMRCIDAGSGGWTSEDPAAREPRYTYGRGAPTQFVDPTGGATLVEYGLIGVCVSVPPAFFLAAADAAKWAAFKEGYVAAMPEGALDRLQLAQEAANIQELKDYAKLYFGLGMAVTGGCIKRFKPPKPPDPPAPAPRLPDPRFGPPNAY